MNGEPVVIIVDDDESIRDSLGMLLESVDRPSKCFSSGNELLDQFDPDWSGCMLVDIRMPGISGIELQEQLIERGSRLPIIFITGHGDVPMAVDALHKGAFDFIQKPFKDDELLDRIAAAVEKDAEERNELEQLHAIQERYDTLTPREKEVMGFVVQGLANKVIAMDLGLSQRTVEVHRARVMEKMGVRSLAELVRQAVSLQSV